ncbi:MAG: extracellular solute-binding protein [Planctomycetes bacterium]|nr:extracellular solute-binding protein [Planctomycetota bacterium]
MRTALRRTRAAFVLVALCALLACGGLAGCAKEPDLTVYCAHDQVFAEPLIRRYAADRGLDVRVEFDIEGQKTVGLVKRIIEEDARTRCDVFWNNEAAHSARLAERGLLASYDSPNAAAIPAEFKDPERRWTGFGARARVLIVNTNLADPTKLGSVRDLLDPAYKGKTCMAKPLTGTTLSHAAAWIDLLGESQTLGFLKELQAAGVAFVQSNGQVMRLVSSGEMAYGMTDTDDFNVARLKGSPVAVVYPDQAGDGTLVIPNTVMVLAKAPHPEAARKFVDWLLSKEVEAELARSDAAQIPVRPDVPRPEHVRSTADFKTLKVDWTKIGADLERRFQLMKELFVE